MPPKIPYKNSFMIRNLSKELHDKLRIIAAQKRSLDNKSSINSIIIEAITEYIKKGN